MKALIIHEGKFLALKRSDNNLWDIPGGRMESGESCEQALAREVFEETGCHLDKIIHIIDASTVFLDESRQVVRITYLCSLAQGRICLSDEHTRFSWLPLNTITDVDETVKRCLSIAGIWLVDIFFCEGI